MKKINYQLLPGETIEQWAERVRRKDEIPKNPTRASELPDEHIIYEGWFRRRPSIRTRLRRMGIQ